MTQQDIVLDHLRRAPITSRLAFREYDIAHLPDIIFRLRKHGFKIKTHTVGSGSDSYARYILQ